MTKVLQRILLQIAVITVISHSILPHYHHEELPIAVQHHHHDEEQPTGQHEHDDDDNSQKGNHSLFSFAQLDENFVPVKLGDKKFELPVTFLPALVICWLSEKVYNNSQITFGLYIEYPPPDDYLFNLPSRAPPAIV